MRGRSRLILTGVAVALACLLLYFFFVKPQKTELASVRAQIATEQTRTTQLQAELARLQDLQANAPELEAELSEIRRSVPTRPDLENFIFQVQDAADRAGLDFVQISPGLPKPPLEGAALAEVRTTIGAAGGYFALQDFLRRLHNLDRAVRVDTMDIGVGSLAPFGTRLTMTIVARVFYELPAPPVAGTVTGSQATPSPTPTGTTTP